jgi:hypothetical protein
MTKESHQRSGVMKAATSAADKVSSWSSSKQDFARRVTTSGSFKTNVSVSSRQGEASTSDKKK